MPEADFDIHQVLQQVAQAVEPFPKAAMFALLERGYRTLFQQLVACVISIRTRDEVSLPTAIRLFQTADKPEALLRLTAKKIDHLIQECSFHERKAEQILAIAQRAVEEFDGELPCDREMLLSFHGVGPKCANLALGIACGEALISVDVHVHRITNRWGYIQARTPEGTLEALKEKLPQTYWLDINRWLVPFGKQICTGRLPKCTTCPVLDMCDQVGVDRFR